MANWNSLDEQSSLLIPPQYRLWIADHQSLTALLKEYCGNQFSVRVLSEVKRVSLIDEQTLLGLEKGDDVMERSVYLLDGEQPMVFARSLLPIKAMLGVYTKLGNMGDQPLGEWLFNDKRIKRGLIEWSCIDVEDPLFPLATSGLSDLPEKVYGRRSLCYGAPVILMVSEFFLPAISRFSKLHAENRFRSR